MQIDPDTLPDEPTVLQQMLRMVLHQQGELHAENDKLRLLIQRLTRHEFGRRSEQLTADQLQFGLEELEQTSPTIKPGRTRRSARVVASSKSAPNAPPAITECCRRTCRVMK